MFSTSRVFVIPSTLTKDEMIDAIEFVPGNKKIVQSCTISIDTGQTGSHFDNNDDNYGYRILTGLGFIPFNITGINGQPMSRLVFYILPVRKKNSCGQ